MKITNLVKTTTASGVTGRLYAEIETKTNEVKYTVYLEREEVENIGRYMILYRGSSYDEAYADYKGIWFKGEEG